MIEATGLALLNYSLAVAPECRGPEQGRKDFDHQRSAAGGAGRQLRPIENAVGQRRFALGAANEGRVHRRKDPYRARTIPGLTPGLRKPSRSGRPGLPKRQAPSPTTPTNKKPS